VDNVLDLGIVLDSHLTMSAQVSSVCRSAFYQLRPVVRSLTTNAARRLYPYAWTTATHYFTASPAAWYDDYTRFRTLRHVSLRVRGGAIISAHIGSCIGYQFTSV